MILRLSWRLPFVYRWGWWFFVRSQQRPRFRAQLEILTNTTKYNVQKMSHSGKRNGKFNSLTPIVDDRYIYLIIYCATVV